jgi:hypothetical protein
MVSTITGAETEGVTRQKDGVQGHFRLRKNPAKKPKRIKIKALKQRHPAPVEQDEVDFSEQHLPSEPEDSLESVIDHLSH